MMLMFMVLTISISFCYGLENAKLNYKCSTEPDTMTVEAVYTGAGTPLTVVWSYSGDPGTTLEILVSTCKVFGSLPSGFPVASRLSYKCVTTHPSLSPNTYQLILADVQSDELKETWGVTFSPPVGVAPAAVQLPIPDDCITTTTTSTKTPASTTTTTPAYTPTTTPAFTTMTTSSTKTTTTPASTTTTTPSSSTTTAASTTTITPASTTTTTPSTSPTSTLRTKTTPVTTPSTTSLSDEMIMVIVIVPVGVIALVGSVTLFCLFYRLRAGKSKPSNHDRHKHGKHYKGNIRTAQQHQQPYILYSRGHTRESNHKETKRSPSLHYDHRYNLYNGYHWGSQVKQNPVYKGDRNLSRLYYNEMLPRYDDYRSGYTTGHVYPSHTSGYQYRRDYHGDSRRHGDRQHSSYPVYSRQQEYIDPSYSYIGY